MSHFYIINKRLTDKIGTVISRHKTFQAAEKAVLKLNNLVLMLLGKSHNLPIIIIESKRYLRNGSTVNPGDYQ